MGAAETWLTPDEIGELTNCRQRWSAQCRALARMGIPFMPNAAGRPLVRRDAVIPQTTKHRVRREPDWDAINGKTA